MATLVQAFRAAVSFFNSQPKPTYIKRDPATGTITHEEWRKGQALHRSGGPAYTVRDAATGIATLEQWRKNNELHRANGPALIVRHPQTGNITHEEWWRNGQQIAPPSSTATPAPGPEALNSKM